MLLLLDGFYLDEMIFLKKKLINVKIRDMTILRKKCKTRGTIFGKAGNKRDWIDGPKDEGPFWKIFEHFRDQIGGPKS